MRRSITMQQNISKAG